MVYTCNYVTGCLEGIHTILIVNMIQTGSDQRLTHLSFEQMLAVSAQLGVYYHGRNTMKGAFLFLSPKARTPSKITRGQHYGVSGSDCWFISRYYGNENALSTKRSRPSVTEQSEIHVLAKYFETEVQLGKVMVLFFPPWLCISIVWATPSANGT